MKKSANTKSAAENGSDTKSGATTKNGSDTVADAEAQKNLAPIPKATAWVRTPLACSASRTKAFVVI